MPVNQLPEKAPRDCWRVLVNQEIAGEDVGLRFQENPHDVFLQGDCDEIIQALVAQLGWEAEYRSLLDERHS